MPGGLEHLHAWWSVFPVLRTWGNIFGFEFQSGIVFSSHHSGSHEVQIWQYFISLSKRP